MKLRSGIIELKPDWFVRLPCPMTEMEMAKYRFGPLAPIAMIAGIGLSAYGKYQEGRAGEAEMKSMAAMSEYNAKVQENEARAIEQKAAFDATRQAEQGERYMSSLQANIGASGGTGTSLLVQGKSAEELELENLLIGYEGQVGSQRALSQAAQDRMQGKLYKQKGKNLKKAGYIGAGTSLLTGFGAMA